MDSTCTDPPTAVIVIFADAPDVRSRRTVRVPAPDKVKSVPTTGVIAFRNGSPPLTLITRDSPLAREIVSVEDHTAVMSRSGWRMGTSNDTELTMSFHPLLYTNGSVKCSPVVAGAVQSPSRG